MRLHSLQITAFGPFAGTVEVDLDALGQAQVFLLCGDIGAGKTMVLDAVCFALYGDVPTDRGRARSLRSHFAAEGVAPRVVLEASVGERRLRFTRSPAWQRPKKRGAGTTTEQPSALVEEHVAGRWVARATRLDEAGALVGDLLGMTLPQFTQVAMLPQGQFDTFLRASSEDRQRVLTRLFRTHRFEEVERWLAERRATLRRSGEARQAQVAGLLHRVSETTASPLPAWDDLGLAVDEREVDVWLAGLDAAAAERTTLTAADLVGATADLDAAVAAESAGRRIAGLRERHAVATRRRAELDADLAAHRRDAARLAAARRAALVTEPRRAAERAHDQVASAAATLDRALAEVTALPGEETPDPATLDRRAVAAAERAALANGFVPRARELADVRTRLDELGHRVRQLTARRDALAERSAALPGEVALAERSLTERAALAAREQAVREQLIALARRVSRFATMTELQFQVEDFTARRDQQQVVVLDLRQRLLDVREERLLGMAAELASAMAVGASCPVCGSHDHPHPAVPAAGAPDDDAEQQAQSALDDAEVLLETHRDQVRSYTGRLTAITEELAEHTEAETVSALEVARVELAGAEDARGGLAESEQTVASLREDLAATREQAGRTEADLAVAVEQHTTAERVVERLLAELAEVLQGEAAQDDVVASVQQHARSGQRAARSLAAARDALARHRQLLDHAEAADAHADEVARAQGFADVVEAAGAELEPDGVADLEQAAARRARDEAAVSATLADPEVREAAEATPVDVGGLEARRHQATVAHARATTAADVAARQHARLVEQGAALHELLAAWRPEREDYAVVRSLSELAEGKGPENTAQVRLSAYVLAARLGQVVAAANERLTPMTGGRYLLEHTARRGVGERRGGLSLLVQDLWTDALRDPVTLSGGETFLVSLALALGLADVVSAEAGGVVLDTLFVDEGFGSLDGDTLELVMDTLDELRSGGRVVGVVSHVPELQTRIPAQLRVHKGREGSWLELGLGSPACR
ncbi:SMC family ATPase [Nocardioides mangrovicus]|uniref:Nuclease SbcCD subunit C n=1 Tax=Nocardioides mangrovicus TaxID=2478913 RepID=A0A3L8P2K0_9ACTN|nr:SMC family ATPase [Nocardioides mangrovicus]RLV48658.1 SMC family ATPase [Nocardioides mangrovicus]